MKQQKHLTKAGLEEIIEIAYSMNLDNNSQTRLTKIAGLVVRPGGKQGVNLLYYFYTYHFF